MKKLKIQALPILNVENISTSDLSALRNYCIDYKNSLDEGEEKNNYIRLAVSLSHELQKRLDLIELLRL